MATQPLVTGYEGFLNASQQVVIPASGQLSQVITTGGLALCGILVPAGFTGTAITFEMCDTAGGTFIPVNNSSGPVSYTVAASNYYSIDPKDFQGIQFLIIKSGSAQSAQSTLVASLKGF